MEKTHWKKVFNSDFLGSCDLEDGKDLKVVIKSVTIQQVKGSDGKKKECNVATFTDTKIKPMILNATNCKTIKKFTKTPYINDWANVPIQIYIKNDVQAFGDVTEGLRIRDFQPTQSKPKLSRTMPAWAKAVQMIKDKTKTLADIELVYDLTGVRDELLREAV